MAFCDHPRMGGGARRDHCPACGYSFYYGDAHATDPAARESRLENPGRDRRALGYADPEPPPVDDDWRDHHGHFPE